MGVTNIWISGYSQVHGYQIRLSKIESPKLVRGQQYFYLLIIYIHDVQVTDHSDTDERLKVVLLPEIPFIFKYSLY